jgi:hypothetical protein
VAEKRTPQEMQPAANFIAKRLAPYLATGLEADDISEVIAEALSDLTRIASVARTLKDAKQPSQVTGSVEQAFAADQLIDRVAASMPEYNRAWDRVPTFRERQLGRKLILAVQQSSQQGRA